MTMGEAIFYIKELQKTYASTDKKVAEAVGMVIEALSDEAEQGGIWHNSYGFAHCSKCGRGVSRPLGEPTRFKFCPYCGRPMANKENEK